MTLPVHRKVPVAVDSYESYGSSNVFTSCCRSVNIIADSLNAHGRMSIPRSTKNNAWIAHGRINIPRSTTNYAWNVWVSKFALHWMNSRVDNDSWIHYATRTTPQPVMGPSQVLCAEKVLSVSNDMHGSTMTREYIRRPVRLVRMDKSALRVDTSRQYWTTLPC